VVVAAAEDEELEAKEEEWCGGEEKGTEWRRA
jgi:hypothetical protein